MGKKEEEKEWERVVALKATKEKEKEREILFCQDLQAKWICHIAE
jgi:hypothetical protein